MTTTATVCTKCLQSVAWRLLTAASLIAGRVQRIGNHLHSFSNRKTSAYRIGGDEFVILLFHDNEEEIVGIGKKLKEKAAEDGYSISVGYAVCGEDRDLNAAIAESDRLMYEDKAKYYQTTGRERRKSRAPKTEE